MVPCPTPPCPSPQETLKVGLHPHIMMFHPMFPCPEAPLTKSPNPLSQPPRNPKGVLVPKHHDVPPTHHFFLFFKGCTATSDGILASHLSLLQVTEFVVSQVTCLPRGCGGSWCFCGGVFVVFLWLCFCGGVVVFLWWCLCGGVFVVVFLWWCFCGGVFVVVFLWWCFLWWCFCGGVFVVVWWCFCGGVVVFLWWCACGGLVVFLWWCWEGVLWRQSIDTDGPTSG